MRQRTRWWTLALAAVVSVATWFAWRVWRFLDETWAIASLKKQGALVAVDRSESDLIPGLVEDLRLRHPPTVVMAEGTIDLRLAACLERLRDLRVSGTIPDAQLPALATMQHLKSFSLGFAEVDPRVL